MDKVDWNQLRAFLETAETGSLSAAARKLGQSQPTLSRQVAALELALGVTLFERVGKTMALTTTGQELLGHARVMGAAAHELGLAATGRSEEVAGVVSVATSDAVAAYLMPKILLQIREAAPGIQVEVVASDGFSDLLRREADHRHPPCASRATGADWSLGTAQFRLLLRVRKLGARTWPAAYRRGGGTTRLYWHGPRRPLPAAHAF